MKGNGNGSVAWLVLAAFCLSSCGSDGSQYTPLPASAPDGLSYPDPNMFVQGVAITPLDPTLEKGTPTSYWVEPDLPPGLRLDGNGRIIGTPNTPKATATYLVTAGNATGTTSFGVRITISGRFTVGGTVTGLTGAGLVLTNNGANNLTINANGPFTMPGVLQAGAAYVVAVATQPSGQTCGVSQGNGFLNNDNYVRVEVACSAVTNKAGPGATMVGGTFSDLVKTLGDGKSVRLLHATCVDVSMLGDLLYEFESGAASPLQGCERNSVAVDPSGLWAYVTNDATHSVAVYALRVP